MISFREMSESEFKKYEENAIVDFAREKEISDQLNSQDALKLAQESYLRLLPDGFKTEGQQFFCIMLNGTSIGMIWLGSQGFIYDFLIDEKFRGKGFGKESLLLLESHCKKMGLKAIKLHVFEHNTYARSLYEKVGYLTTGRTMLKKI